MYLGNCRLMYVIGMGFVGRHRKGAGRVEEKTVNKMRTFFLRLITRINQLVCWIVGNKPHQVADL